MTTAIPPDKMNITGFLASTSGYVGNASTGASISDVDEIAAALQQHRIHLSKAINYYIIPILAPLGCIGNSLSIAVLTRPVMRSSTNFYLTALAVADILYLISSLTMSLRHWPNVQSKDGYNYYYHYGKCLTSLASNTSVLLTVTFTVERFIAIRHPMKGMVWCTPERAKWFIASVCVSALIITLPEFWENKPVKQFDANTNSTNVRVQSTSFGESKAYVVGYIWFLCTIITYLPLVILVVFNGLLLHSVIQANTARRVMTHSRHTQDTQREQTRITMMVISIIVVFLLCQTPWAVTSTYIGAKRSYLQAHPYAGEQIRIVGTVANFLVALNTSVNIMLYSFFSSKFRRTAKRLFCKRKHMANGGPPGVTGATGYKSTEKLHLTQSSRSTKELTTGYVETPLITSPDSNVGNAVETPLTIDTPLITSPDNNVGNGVLHEGVESNLL